MPHTMQIDGFTFAKYDFASNIPRALDTLGWISGRAGLREFEGRRGEEARKELQKFGRYSFRTCGGLFCLIRRIDAGPKARFVVLALQSSAPWIERGCFEGVEIPPFDERDLVERCRDTANQQTIAA